ncbi:hypothetical protein AGOR_G00088100 [Albula goreensis]|uniref:G-protein coupled receptor n=1 Tax=Albula goreensis TaxID=1534307 RepID=A0A8T3DUH2_9TELE|nr:hypothetical protein AGOR_G00088100 [Albula goreensis]
MLPKRIHIVGITAVLFSFVCFPEVSPHPEPCKMDNFQSQNWFLLVDDYYTGVIRAPNGNTENKPESCPVKETPCIISLRMENVTENSVNISDEIKIHSKDNKTYTICQKKQLGENKMGNLYFLPRRCAINVSYSQGEEKTTPSAIIKADIFKNGAITCQGKFKYNGTRCIVEEEGDQIIEITCQEERNTGQKCPCTPNCVTCKNPVTKPSTNVEMPFKEEEVVSEEGEIDATFAAKTMRNFSNIVDTLGNKSAAVVSMGPIKGVIKKEKKNTEFKELFFGLPGDSSVAIIEDVTTLEQQLPGLVSIPGEAFAKASNSSRNDPFVAVLIFPNMTKDANNSRVFRSEVLAIEMGAEIKNLTKTVNITFIREQGDNSNMTCGSWNGQGDRPVWTTDGCETIEINGAVICQCSHLTFFAILMSDPGANISSSDLKSLTYITYIGCGMSMFFLGVAMFMHFLLRRTKANHATQILMNLFMAMFLLNLCFLCSESVAKLNIGIACKLMAAILHYSMLSTFTWFAVEAFHLCLQLIKSFNINIRHYIIKVCITGWALPGLVIIVLFILGKYGSLTINSDNEESVKMCWITDGKVHYIVNVGYYAMVFLFTFCVFIVIARRLTYMKRVKPDASMKGSGTGSIISILGLCCLLGITWGFAFFSYGPLRIPSYYIFTILNSFQGFFLFLYYYNTNKIIGEDKVSSSSTKTASTINSTLETQNPYSN